MELLTAIQKENFLSISGVEYTKNEPRGWFDTPSGWEFTYVIDETTGDLICELAHRMLGINIYGWDKLGNALPNSVLHKYFTPYY